MWLVPPTSISSGTFLGLNYWNTRTRRFGRLSVARVNASISTTGVRIGAGLMGHATGGSLIGASILGSAVSTIVLGGQIWRDDRRMLNKEIKWPGLMAGFRRYRRFPIYDSWGALLNTISWQLPSFLLSSFFSPKVVGYYALGVMVLQLPTSLIGSAISQVFFQRAALAKIDGTLAELVENIVLHLGIIGIFPILLLSFIGEESFIVVFGNPWAEAGVYAHYLALWIFFLFITSPISTLFSVLEKQNISLIINIIIFPVRAGALIIGGMVGDPRLSIILFSAAGVIIYAGANLWFMKMAGCSIIHILKKFSKYLAYSILLLSCVGLAKWFLLLDPKHLVIVGGVAMIIYYVIVIKNERIFNLELEQI